MKYAFLLLLAVLQIASNFILWHKRYSRVSRYFTFFTGALIVWTLANIALDYATNNTGAFNSIETRIHVLNLANKIGFCAGALILVVLYRLILIFPKPRETSPITTWVTLAGVIVTLLTFFPFVSGSYTISSEKTAIYHYGPLSLLIMAYFILVATLVVRSLLKSLHQSLDPRVRRQAKSIITALLFTGGWAVFFILLLPAIFKTGESTLIVGYFAPYIFTGVLLYSILRQGFLNFNLIIARSLGYALSLGLLMGGFILISLTFIQAASDSRVTLNEALVFAVFNIITALMFRPTKRFFDKISNRLFYRDAYDSQELIDKLNRTFVAYTNLEELLMRSAQTIEDALKINFCYFVITDSSNIAVRVAGSVRQQITPEDTKRLHTMTTSIPYKVILAEDLEEKHHGLYTLMRSKDVSLLGRLTPDISKTAGLGYMLFGEKRSGNPYTLQDLRTIELIVNELFIAVESSLRFEEIQNFNKTLQERINQATKELRRTNEKLKTLDETKDEFISMASHQLRTPLTSVKGYLSMVLEGDAGRLNKQQKQLLTQSFISSQRMVYLIADLLNLSRLNTGKFVIEATPVDLREVVQGEIDQLRETAKSRDLTLVYESPAEFPTLMLDETKIHQVVMNFIDNAIYYTPAGGTITIELRETPTAVEYVVKDNGIGVPKSEQHRLFTKFYRAGNARRARPDGTGLGLFMAKKVIAAQGGSVLFQSEEGKGSMFGFRFSKAHRLAPVSSEDSANAASLVK